MIVAVPGLPPVDLGITETTPTVGITDYSRRVTDDFGVTSVTKRGFSRKLSLRFAVPFGNVDALHARLADLRATQATWIADDRFRALSVIGRYKDFSIDVASQPCSFCTLTVDGFAESLDYPDNGSDPAADGASTFRLLQPVAVTDAVLRASSVPEDDAPAWSAGGTYAKGARVVVGHRVYESLIDGNIGNDPVSSTQWLDTGSTNRFAMFDQALGSATTAAGSIVVTLSSSKASALAVLDVIGATVRVQGAGYDDQRAAGGTIIFDSLPGGDITVTVTGSGMVEVGTLLFGQIVSLGVTETNPTAEITDYSRKETDDFGDVTVVERAWAKRMAGRTIFRTDSLDLVFERISTVRALPSLWIADEGTDALSIYGFCKDFSIEVGETTSKLSLQIEGLSKAAKVQPFGSGQPGKDGKDGKDGASAVTLVGSSASVIVDRNSARGTKGQGWGGEAVYSRESYTGGAVCTFTFPALHGDDIMAGLSQFTATQAGSQPGDGYETVTFALFRNSNNSGGTEARINGDRWAVGPTVAGELRGRVHFDGRYVRWYVNEQQIGGAFDWMRGTDDPNAPVHALRFRAALAGASPTVENVTLGAAGAVGAVGPDGYNVATILIYRRATSQPPLPSETATWTFSTATLAGLTNGWSLTIPAGTDPVWASAATASARTATDQIAPGEWASPVQVFADGKSIRSKSLFIYQRAASTPALPSQNAVYTFSSATLTGLNAGWQTEIPSGGGILWVSTATAFSPTDTDNINPSEWAAAAKMSQDGEDGIDGFSIETDTPVFAVPCFSDGSPDPARWSGGSGKARLRKGGAVIGGVAFSIVSQSAMTGLSVNGSGDYSFSGLSADTGFFVVRASYAGQVFDLKVDVKKVRDGSAAFKASISMTSDRASGQTTVPGGRTVRVSAAASYFLNHEGAFQGRMNIYVRNLTDGAAYQFLGSKLGSQAYRYNVGTPGEPVYDQASGDASAAFTFTSAASDKQYEYLATLSAENGGYADIIDGQAMLEVIA